MLAVERQVDDRERRERQRPVPVGVDLERAALVGGAESVVAHHVLVEWSHAPPHNRIRVRIRIRRESRQRSIVEAGSPRLELQSGKRRARFRGQRCERARQVHARPRYGAARRVARDRRTARRDTKLLVGELLQPLDRRLVDVLRDLEHVVRHDRRRLRPSRRRAARAAAPRSNLHLAAETRQRGSAAAGRRGARAGCPTRDVAAAVRGEPGRARASARRQLQALVAEHDARRRRAARGRGSSPASR